MSMHIVAANQQSDPALRRYVAACVSLALIFITLMLLVVFAPGVSSLDSYLSQSMQSLRSPMLDRLMLVITMSADFTVATSIMVGLFVLLLFAQRWWLAIHLGSVYIAAKLGVVIFKLFISRARPEMSVGSLEFFSFPSGHACTAAVVTGVVSALVAYRKPVPAQYCIYGLGFLLAILVSVSRVYLLAHWPTDVIAGALFGYSLVIAFAWQLHAGTMLEIKALTPMLLIFSALSLGTYVYYSFNEQASHYALSISN